MLPKDTLLLDLGGYEIKGMFLDEKSDKVIFVKEKKTGLDNGYVNDVFLFQTAVLNTIKNIEGKVHKKISNVLLLLSGKILEYRTLSVQNLNVNGVVNQYKMDLFSKRVKQWVEEKNAILLRYYPVEYILDDYKIENPYGLYVDVLSFKYFVCYSLKSKINNLIYLLEQLNLNVVDLIPSIFALADRYLSEDEKRLGSIIFDIGHTKIHWSFYFKGVPVKAGNINLGSDFITAKIARSLKVSLEEATNIKHEYLSAVLKPEHFCSWIRVVKESNEEFVLQSEMIRKILPEVISFVDEIKKIIEVFVKQKAYHAVFCGNASYLSDLVDSMQKTSSMRFKTVCKDSIFGVSDNIFKDLKNEKGMNKFLKFLRKFLNHFFDT